MEGRPRGSPRTRGQGARGRTFAGCSPLPRRPPWGVQVTHLCRPLGHRDTSHLVATFRPEGDGPRPLRSRRQPTRKPRLTSGIRKTDVSEADLALTTMERTCADGRQLSQAWVQRPRPRGSHVEGGTSRQPGCGKDSPVPSAPAHSGESPPKTRRNRVSRRAPRRSRVMSARARPRRRAPGTPCSRPRFPHHRRARPCS